MSRARALIAFGVALVACGGQLASEEPTDPYPPVSTATDGGFGDGPYAYPPSNDDGGISPNDPQPTPTVDAVANKGSFTAMALAPSGMLYVAETVYDNGTGGAAPGTTLWEVKVGGDLMAPKTEVLTGANIGVALALGFRAKPASVANLVWIDGQSASGALKTNAAGTTVSTLTGSVIVGTTLASLLGDLYGDSDNLGCVELIDGQTPGCTGARFSNALQGGSGFHIIPVVAGSGPVLVSADNGGVYSALLDGSGKTTSVPLSPAIMNDAGLPPVFDVTAAADGTLYLATSSGVWERDLQGGYTNLYGASQIQQVELTSTGVLVVNEVGVGLVRIDPRTLVSRIMSDDLAINTRFAIDSQNAYFIGAAQNSLLHTSF